VIALQRQGQFGVFSPGTGQEASIIGSAMAVDPSRDWMVPQYRELMATVHHGLPLEVISAQYLGKIAPARIPDGVKVLPTQVSIAAQLPHATGLAWGLRLRGEDSVVIAYIGEGGSSEGDFHEALNLAGVVHAPIVFFLQNNQWAISTSRRVQSATQSFALRAAGYGFEGVEVDGNGPDWSTGAESEMPQRNVVEAINNALADEMESDPRVMVLGLDVGKLGGVFRTTSGLVERFGTDRVVDTPLAEASIIGASLG